MFYRLIPDKNLLYTDRHVQKGTDKMRYDQNTEISVKTVFAGRNSAEQVFIDLIRRRITSDKFEFIRDHVYNKIMVFPRVHTAPQRGKML